MLASHFIVSITTHWRLHMTQNEDIWFCKKKKGADLQLKTDEHDQEDKADAQDTHGQADQPPEQAPPPRRIVELFTAGNGTAALHSL